MTENKIKKNECWGGHEGILHSGGGKENYVDAVPAVEQVFKYRINHTTQQFHY